MPLNCPPDNSYVNPCEDCQDNIPATPSNWTPSLPACTDGCEITLPTDCVLHSADVSFCGAEYPAGTPITSFLVDIASAACCECVSCNQVEIAIESQFAALSKQTSIFQTLQPNYFTKGNFINSVTLEDNSSINLDVLKYVKYTAPTLSAMKVSQVIGNNMILQTSICGNNLIEYGQHPVIIELQTSRNCYDLKECYIAASRVDYSERIGSPFRFNAQINNAPVVRDYSVDVSTDKGILYYADTIVESGVNKGSVIRRINLNTKELVTISGSLVSQPNDVNYFKTIDGANGTDVIYAQASAINIDRYEAHNGEPVLYFATFGRANLLGGTVCRMVKTSDCNDCDERSNWTTHVIVNINNVMRAWDNSFLNTEKTGTQAELDNCYTLKQWYYVNNAPSFYLRNRHRIVYVWYSGDGDINSSTSWRVQNVVDSDITTTGILGVGGWAAGGAAGPTLNVEDIDRGDGLISKRLIVTFQGAIIHYDWINPTPTTPSEALDINSSSWSKTVVVQNLVSGNNTGSFNSGTVVLPVNNGAAVNVYNPQYIYKYNNTYLYGSEQGGTIRTTIRKYTTNDDVIFTHSILCPELNPAGTANQQSSVCNTGAAAGMNGFSGGFFTDLQGDLYDIVEGGIRLWDLTGETSTLFMGGSSSSSTQGTHSMSNISGNNTVFRMDTQYELTLNCE